jgi:hypothetical protein
MQTHKTADPDQQNGISKALKRAFNGTVSHVAARSAEADFAQLLEQLNDPPPQYREGAKA